MTTTQPARLTVINTNENLKPEHFYTIVNSIVCYHTQESTIEVVYDGNMINVELPSTQCAKSVIMALDREKGIEYEEVADFGVFAKPKAYEAA